MTRTQRIVWALLALCSVAACDAIIGPGILSGTAGRLRYPLVMNALRAGMTRGELYGRLASIGQPVELSSLEDGSLSLEFDHWHLPCDSIFQQVDVHFDTTWDARAPEIPSNDPRIPVHSLDRVTTWESRETSASC